MGSCREAACLHAAAAIARPASLCAATCTAAALRRPPSAVLRNTGERQRLQLQRAARPPGCAACMWLPATARAAASGEQRRAAARRVRELLRTLAFFCTRLLATTDTVRARPAATGRCGGEEGVEEAGAGQGGRAWGRHRPSQCWQASRAPSRPNALAPRGPHHAAAGRQHFGWLLLLKRHELAEGVLCMARQFQRGLSEGSRRGQAPVGRRPPSFGLCLAQGRSLCPAPLHSRHTPSSHQLPLDRQPVSLGPDRLKLEAPSPAGGAFSAAARPPGREGVVSGA